MTIDAMVLDEQEVFKPLTALFDMPVNTKGAPLVYLNGNSLGPKPKRVNEAVRQHCDTWGSLGVRGHFDGANPWMSYHQRVAPQLARLVGAKPHEVVAMGTLTGNLHLLFMSFYRPTPTRYKIIHFAGFPSDTYAVRSQVQLRLQTLRDFQSDATLEHAVIEITPDDTGYIAWDTIEQVLATHGSDTAVVWFEAVHYLTGQRFDIERITQLAHHYGCKVGFDLAHAIGNVEVQLHEHDVDFAVWCHYKYVSAGPGAIAGLYVHERFACDPNYPRLAGWWGNKPATRFHMSPDFDPILGAEGWQLSNAELFSLSALHEALCLFDTVDLTALRAKNTRLVAYLEQLMRETLQDNVVMITPENPAERGCQLSFRLIGVNHLEHLETALLNLGVVCDVRRDVLRVAPMGLYNTFQDVFYFVCQLNQFIQQKSIPCAHEFSVF